MTEKSVAILSNVNMNALIRILSKNISTYHPEGYGNELGIMMNPESSYHTFAPDITFLFMDLCELLNHETEETVCKNIIHSWFASLLKCMKSDKIYYVNDGVYFSTEYEMLGNTDVRERIECLWRTELDELCSQNANVRVFPYRQLILSTGIENAFSMKMWYMGKILLGSEAQKRLVQIILHKVKIESRFPKKVLLLDLDNTLWGGLAGEQEHQPIALSDDHLGGAYKNLQRVISQMQRQGVILGIVSKNNESDAEKILMNHPHMVLKSTDFAIKKINWLPKNENILSIAKELNLGLDSFVFFDDNPQERLLVQQMLPQVTVPEFPKEPEELAPCMIQIFREYFEKAALTQEDFEKTKQYADNAKRQALQDKMMSAAGNFEEYLKTLEIRIIRENSEEHINRLLDLLNKTNQFNLTTIRHVLGDLKQTLNDADKRVFLYRVQDCFGDYGIVAAIIVSVQETTAVIEEFVMSCRIMGKNIEMGIISDVEACLLKEGCRDILGCFYPTAKNKPVENLYDRLGYKKYTEENGKLYYKKELTQNIERDFVGIIVS